MDRRHFVAGVGATIVAGPAQVSVAVDRFGPSASGGTVILLYGSDGLTNSGRYEFAANMIAGAGYNVLLPRYFEATGDRPATVKSRASSRCGWKRSSQSPAITRPVSPLSASRWAVHWSWLWRHAIAGLKLSSTSSDSCRRAWSEPRSPLRSSCMGKRTEWCLCLTAGAIERLVKSSGGTVQRQWTWFLTGELDAILRTHAFLRENL